jgi:hypothetical protein
LSSRVLDLTRQLLDLGAVLFVGRRDVQRQNWPRVSTA